MDADHPHDGDGTDSYLPRGSPELNPQKSVGDNSIKNSGIVCSRRLKIFVMLRSLLSTGLKFQISSRTYVRKYEYRAQVLQRVRYRA